MSSNTRLRGAPSATASGKPGAAPGPWSTGTVQVALGRLAVPVVGAVIWAIAAQRSELVPGIGESLDALASGLRDGTITGDLWATVTAVAAGFAMAWGVAFPLGVLLARQKFLAATFEPVIAGLFAVPRIIFYPVFLGILGVGVAAISASAAVSAFFPILITTIAAIKGVRETLVKLGRSLNMSTVQLVRKVLLPAAAPALMVGFRVGFSIAFISVIISEFFAARDGLGLRVAKSYAQMEMPQMFGVIVLILVIALVGNLALWGLERRIARSA